MNVNTQSSNYGSVARITLPPPVSILNSSWHFIEVAPGDAFYVIQ